MGGPTRKSGIHRKTRIGTATITDCAISAHLAVDSLRPTAKRREDSRGGEVQAAHSKCASPPGWPRTRNSARGGSRSAPIPLAPLNARDEKLAQNHPPFGWTEFTASPEPDHGMVEQAFQHLPKILGRDVRPETSGFLP